MMGYWGIGKNDIAWMHGCGVRGVSCGFNVNGRGDLAPTLTNDSTPIMNWKIARFLPIELPTGSFFLRFSFAPVYPG